MEVGGVRQGLTASHADFGCDMPSAGNAALSLTSFQTDADTTVTKQRELITSPAPRISSADRLRMKTCRLQRELQELIVRHDARHERLQGIRTRQSVSWDCRSGTCRNSSQSFFSGSRPSEKKTESIKLPNLQKCFEEARTRHLQESRSRRKSRDIPVPYSSHIPPDREGMSHLQHQDVMKNPDSFGLRFFSPLHLQESSLQNQHM